MSTPAVTIGTNAPTARCFISPPERPGDGRAADEGISAHGRHTMFDACRGKVTREPGWRVAPPVPQGAGRFATVTDETDSAKEHRTLVDAVAPAVIRIDGKR